MKIIFASGAAPAAAPAATPAAVIRFVTRPARQARAARCGGGVFRQGERAALLAARRHALRGTRRAGQNQRPHAALGSGGGGDVSEKIGRTRAVVRLEDWPKFAGPVVEGLVLADYRFERFKTKRTPALENVAIHVLAEDLVKARSAGRRGETIATAANLAREVANQPGNLLYPESLPRAP